MLAVIVCVFSDKKFERFVGNNRSFVCVERRAIFSSSSQPCWHKLQRWRLHHSLEIPAEHREVCNDEINLRLLLDFVNCIDSAQWRSVVVFLRGYLISSTEKSITGWSTGTTKLNFGPICKLSLTELANL